MAKQDRSNKTFLKTREFLYEDPSSLSSASGEITAFGGYMDASLKFFDGSDTVYFDFSTGDSNEDLRRVNRMLSFLHSFRDALIAAHKWAEAKGKQEAADKEAKAE